MTSEAVLLEAYRQCLATQEAFWEWRNKLLTALISSMTVIIGATALLGREGVRAGGSVALLSIPIALAIAKLDARNAEILAKSRQIGMALETELALPPACRPHEGFPDRGRHSYTDMLPRICWGMAAVAMLVGGFAAADLLSGSAGA